MELSAAAWTVIVLALVAANLPFVVERPLAALPWSQGIAGGAGARWLRCLVFVVLTLGWIWATFTLVGGGFAGGGVTTLLFLLKLVLMIALGAGLLMLPAWRSAPGPAPKPFFDRLLEVLVCYALVGTMALSLELSLGNAFPRAWEFYAITLSLFLVLAYPGFVFRYMLKRRRPPARKSA